VHDTTAKDKGDFLEAGSCMEACHGDYFGRICDQACPGNCAPVDGNSPSCHPSTGVCENKCKEDSYFGSTCEHSCSDGCSKGTCDAEDGNCHAGCIAGRWGPTCDEQCPEHTGETGCEREDGMPLACDDDEHYATRDGKGDGHCASCPEHCKDGKCHSDGKCSTGCSEGFFGDLCEKACPSNCDGPCDAKATGKDDGVCQACKQGFTGAECLESCHSQCLSCKQTVDDSSFLWSSVRAGNASNDCTSCHNDGAAMLSDSNVCECIGGATRSDADSKCECGKSDDPMKEGFTEWHSGTKMCSQRCKFNYEGKNLKQIFKLIPTEGGHRLGESKCIDVKLQKAVIMAAGQADNLEEARKVLTPGACPEGSFEFPNGGDEKCLHEQYVAFIIQE